MAFKAPSLYETCPRSAEPRPLTGFATAHSDAGQPAPRPHAAPAFCASPRSSPFLLHHVIYVEKKKKEPPLNPSVTLDSPPSFSVP